MNLGDPVSLFLAGLLLAGILALGWWLLVPTEGVYLGRRVVIGLYDLYAHRYDRVKNYYREYEHIYLAQPIMERIAPLRNPLVLDVATGTGRLPLALARHGQFKGYTIGLDLSRQMLHIASKNIYPFDDQTAFICAPAEELPFPDDTFDVVTCLEALEFMRRPEVVLAELVRVLRPGGLLLISQRVNTRWLPGKTWSSSQILALFEANGVVDGEVQIWQVDYRKVWGRKAGDSAPTGARPPDQVLRCPRCRQGFMRRHKQAFVCSHCSASAAIGADGVVELAG